MNHDTRECCNSNNNNNNNNNNSNNNNNNNYLLLGNFLAKKKIQVGPILQFINVKTKIKDYIQ